MKAIKGTRTVVGWYIDAEDVQEMYGCPISPDLTFSSPFTARVAALMLAHNHAVETANDNVNSRFITPSFEWVSNDHLRLVRHREVRSSSWENVDGQRKLVVGEWSAELWFDESGLFPAEKRTPKPYFDDFYVRERVVFLVSDPGHLTGAIGPNASHVGGWPDDVPKPMTMISITAFSMEHSTMAHFSLRLTSAGRVHMADVNRFLRDALYKVPLRFYEAGIRRLNPSPVGGWPDDVLLDATPELYSMLSKEDLAKTRASMLLGFEDEWSEGPPSDSANPGSCL